MAGFDNDTARAAFTDVTRAYAWFPCVVFGAHIVASKGFGAYVAFPLLDIPMHVLGGVAIAYFFWGAIVTAERHELIGSMETTVRLVLILALTASATVFWEFAEWTTDHTIGTHAQQGLDDTLFDMLCGIAGGTTFALFSLTTGMANRESRV